MVSNKAGATGRVLGHHGRRTRPPMGSSRRSPCSPPTTGSRWMPVRRLAMEKAIQAQEDARLRVRVVAQGPMPSQAQAVEDNYEESDPWLDLTTAPDAEDEALQAVLSRALNGARNMPAQLQSEVAGQATPPSRGPPRTPQVPARPTAVPHAGSAADSGTRLVPFPPPKRPKLGPQTGDDAAMECPYALEDPYQRPFGSPGTLQAALASPPLGKPKPPQAKSALQHKPGAPCPGSTTVEKKRAQVPMASLTVAEDGGRGPAHYQLDYDDEERPGMRGMSSGMD